MKLCKCGCGQGVVKDRTWIRGHAARKTEAREKSRTVKLGNANALGNRANLGRSRSKETREKLRVANLGENNPSYGKTPTRETVRKISVALLGHEPHEGAGRTPWHDYFCKDGRLIRVQGTWELHTCEYLDEIEEEWEYVGQSKTHSFLLSDGSRYYPDFHLPRLSLYLDPKGHEAWAEKARRAQEEYPSSRIEVLLGPTYLDQLKKLLRGESLSEKRQT